MFPVIVVVQRIAKRRLSGSSVGGGRTVALRLNFVGRDHTQAHHRQRKLNFANEWAGGPRRHMGKIRHEARFKPWITLKQLRCQPHDHRSIAPGGYHDNDETRLASGSYRRGGPC